jgi:hypothetical protein
VGTASVKKKQRTSTASNTMESINMPFWANGFRSNQIPGWEDRSTITLVGPTGQDEFAANIVVTRQALGEPSVKAFAEQQLTQLEQETEQIELLKERTTTINGAFAFQRLHILHVGRYQVQQIQTYLVQQIDATVTGFVITCSASASDFPDHLPVFNRFTEAFSFFDPGSLQPV